VPAEEQIGDWKQKHRENQGIEPAEDDGGWKMEDGGEASGNLEP
jgi:hypothetical protein